MSYIKHGFLPVYDKYSKVLILGSFPSVKSRQTEFYYGNPQNRFWKTLSSYFGVATPSTIEEKKQMLLKYNVAIWDVVEECEIEGSKDSSIKNYRVADIKTLLQKTNIRYIILNGGTAFKIFEDSFKDIGVPYVKLSSTSPANTRFNTKDWHNELSRAFGRT